MARAAITHVLFDMDGLLLDTETFYTIAQQQVCARYDKEFTWDLKSKMMGKKALDAAQVLIDELGLEGQLTAQDFLSQREALLDALFPTAQLMPGARRLVEHLHACSIPMAVATSSHRRHYDLKTGQHGAFFAMFGHIVTGDQVANGKPHPEIFQAAAARFVPAPPGPSWCLVFEDAPTGVEAAAAAGMHCVMVPDPNLSASLTRAATQVLRSLEDFAPQEWGLPAFAAAGGGAASRQPV